MRPPGTPLHFSYCLNVHPGETLADLTRTLDTALPPIRQALSPDTPFGLGLRLAAPAAAELRSPAALDRLREQLHTLNLYPFTVNAFPFGAFHQTRVKENVYAPDWRTSERAAYTRNVFHALADLLPPDTAGSVSTVPLAYAARTFSDADRAAVRRQLADLALDLAAHEDTRGQLLHLGLEPEPDCTLETTPQTVHWFENELFHTAARELAGRQHLTPARAEALLRRHIGVCFDTCHVAMQFEDPATSLNTLRHHGIRISKIQLSTALECDNTPEALHALAAFDDGVYLHQVKSAAGRARPDLPALFAEPLPAPDTLRVHCHVPLHWPGTAPLRSTRPTLTPAFWQALHASGCDHLEVETYTLGVLPPALRTQPLPQTIVSECTWALQALERNPRP